MPKEVRNVDGNFIWHEYEEPALAADQIRVQSQFGASKHGTEFAFIGRGHGVDRGRYNKEWTMFLKSPPPGSPPPAPAPAPKPGDKPKPPGGGVGNMTVGIVTEIGADVKNVVAGDRVLIYGGFRQTHTTSDSRCWKIPADFSWKSAVCLDPSDFALGAIRDGKIRVGDAVAIFGMGAIGLMAVQLAKAGGAYPVIAFDPVESRRNIALQVGADLAFDPVNCDAGFEMKKATAKRGVDVVIDYSGKVQAMQAAIRGAAYGGTVVAGAFPAPYPAGLDLGAEAHLNIPQIIFSRSCSEPNRDYPRWDEKRIYSTCFRMLMEGKISGEHIVTPVVDFANAATEYAKIPSQPDVYVKLGVKY